jgi:hypothetical protein
MSQKIITLVTITKWLDDLDTSLKDRLVNTGFDAKCEREDLYSLYQAAQLLRARMLGDFSEQVEFTINQYDTED